MYPVSDAYLAALKSAHQVRTYIQVTKGGVRIYDDLPITAGTITADFPSAVRRKINLTVPARLKVGEYGEIPATEVLGIHGTEVRVRHGLVFPDGTTEWVPVGVFRVDDGPEPGLSGEAIPITGRSREVWIIDDIFPTPRTIEGPSAIALITALIRETLPQAEITVRTTRNARIPAFIEESDRWRAITTIADAISCVVYADGEGRFVITNAPALTDQPVWTIRPGSEGNLVNAAAKNTRENVFNAVFVRAGAANGDVLPMIVAEYDDNPTSLTQWGDPDAGFYGKAPKALENPAITTVAQAKEFAKAALARRVGIANGMDLSTIPNVALEPGDPVLVIPDMDKRATNARKHMVDSFTIPLIAGGEFALTTRDVRDAETTST